MQNKIPAVFISYAWGKFDNAVLELATRLMNDGVAVTLDKWELVGGHDKYAFMEQAVNNPDIDKVLIICDKLYTEKANMRKGGVGDETIIISSEVYGKVQQEKFLPIIFERDNLGKEYCPSYIKSRIYIDLSSDDIYEDEYENLIRNIYKKPLHRKPTLGSIPAWLTDEVTDFSKLRLTIKKLSAINVSETRKFNFFLTQFEDEFVEILKVLKDNLIDQPDTYLIEVLGKEKPLRDLFLDFLEELIQKDINLNKFLPDFFENIYNITHTSKNNQAYSERDFEFYKFCIWELIICAITYLYKYEMYEEIFSLVSNSYSLKKSYFENSDEQFVTIASFCDSFGTIEERIKPKTLNPRLYTLAGEVLINREYRPVITKQSIAFADLLIYQLSQAMNIVSDYGWLWYPRLNCYTQTREKYWSKLRSKKHVEKILPLFGVANIDEFKALLAASTQNTRHKGFGFGRELPIIIDQLSLNELASIK